MTIESHLFGDGYVVYLDDMTAQLGGAFYFTPLRPYSPVPLKWCFDQLLRYPKAVLLDVGASTGCYSLLARYHPNLTVYAFEPVPLTARVLSENVHLNDLESKVHVHQVGISNYNGTGILHSVKALGGSGVSIVDGKPAWHKDCEDIPVSVMTIDAFCELHEIAPTFLKIDTEGAEKLVLEGAAKTIEQYHPFILCEYSPENIDQFGYAPSDIIKKIEDWGYVWTNPEGTDLWCVPDSWEEQVSLANKVETNESNA